MCAQTAHHAVDDVVQLLMSIVQGGFHAQRQRDVAQRSHLDELLLGCLPLVFQGGCASDVAQKELTRRA